MFGSLLRKLGAIVCGQQGKQKFTGRSKELDAYNQWQQLMVGSPEVFLEVTQNSEQPSFVFSTLVVMSKSDEIPHMAP